MSTQIAHMRFVGPHFCDGFALFLKLIALINALLALLGKLRDCRKKPNKKGLPMPLPVVGGTSDFSAFRSDAGLY